MALTETSLLTQKTGSFDHLRRGVEEYLMPSSLSQSSSMTKGGGKMEDCRKYMIPEMSTHEGIHEENDKFVSCWQPPDSCSFTSSLFARKPSSSSKDTKTSMFLTQFLPQTLLTTHLSFLIPKRYVAEWR